jgi:hypothetical protein
MGHTGTSPGLLPDDGAVVPGWGLLAALVFLLVFPQHAVAPYELPVFGRGATEPIGRYKYNLGHLFGGMGDSISQLVAKAKRHTRRLDCSSSCNGGQNGPYDVEG